MAELTIEQKRALALSRSRQRQAAAPAPVAAANGRTPEQSQARIAELDAEIAEIKRQDAPFSTHNDPRGAIVPIASAAIAEPVSGLAGLISMAAGFVGGLAPGGESPLQKGQRFGEVAQRETQDFLTVAPPNAASERVLEGIGIGAEAGVETARLPVAGLAGLFQLGTGAGIEGASETVRRTRDEGIGRTAGQGLERAGAPAIVSSVVEAIPTGIAAAAGVKNPFRKPPATPTPPPRPQFTTEGPAVSVGRPTLDTPVDITPPQPLARVAQSDAPRSPGQVFKDRAAAVEENFRSGEALGEFPGQELLDFQKSLQRPSVTSRGAPRTPDVPRADRQVFRSRLDPDKYIDEFGNDVANPTAAEIAKIDAPDHAATRKEARGVQAEDAAFTRTNDFLDELAPTLKGASNDRQAINLLRDKFPEEARRLGDLKTTGPEIREALADIRLGRRPVAEVKAELAARINEQGPGPAAPPLDRVAQAEPAVRGEVATLERELADRNTPARGDAADVAFNERQTAAESARERLFDLEDQLDEAIQDRPPGRDGEHLDDGISRLRNEVDELEELVQSADVESRPFPPGPQRVVQVTDELESRVFSTGDSQGILDDLAVRFPDEAEKLRAVSPEELLGVISGLRQTSATARSQVENILTRPRKLTQAEFYAQNPIRDPLLSGRDLSQPSTGRGGSSSPGRALKPDEKRIRELEAEGMSRSDAQAVFDAEDLSQTQFAETLAAKHGIETLKTRNVGDLDFPEVNVQDLSAMLEEAFEEGIGGTPSTGRAGRARDAILERIASESGIDTLKVRNRDSLDFHELGVEDIRHMIDKAVDAGRGQAAPSVSPGSTLAQTETKGTLRVVPPKTKPPARTRDEIVSDLDDAEFEMNEAAKRRREGSGNEGDAVIIRDSRQKMDDLFAELDGLDSPAPADTGGGLAEFVEPTLARRVAAQQQPGSATPTATTGRARKPTKVEGPESNNPAAPSVTASRAAVVSADQIVADLKRGKTDKIAAQVVPDVAVIEAAQRLGIDLNPEHYATNTAFQDVARALKSRPGSELLASEVKALRDLADRADELVTDLGGSIDKAGVSDDILSSARSTIDELEVKANEAYTTVRDAIPNNARVETANIREFLEQRLSDLGGDKSLLSTVEKKLFNLVNKPKATPVSTPGGAKPGVQTFQLDEVPDNSITYLALDRVRRDVGDGFNKRSGPFADDSHRALREVYDVLSDTQQGAAEAFGVGEVYTEARQLVRTRKGLEDNAVSMFGRDAAGSLAPQIRAAATGLPKGNVAPLNRLIMSLPVGRRADMAATVLGELFGSGSRQGGQLGTGFAKTWQNLNRNTTARDALLKHLPPEAKRRFHDIGRVIDAIVRSNAKSLANPSGSAGPIIAALEQGTVATKLYGAGKAAAAEGAVTAATGVPGLATILRSFGGGKPQTGRVGAADAFLGSQTFKDAIKVALDGDVAKANRIAENSPQFKRWFESLDENTAANVTNTGFIAWLSSNEEE